MGLFDPSQIANLVGQIGGNHQQAAQMLQSFVGQGQVDTSQHADMLQQMGIDPQQLDNGAYQQHFDAQNQSGFQGYQQGDFSGQQGGGQQYGGQQQQFGGDQYQQQGGGFGGDQGYQDQNQGYQDQGGYQQGGY